MKKIVIHIFLLLSFTGFSQEVETHILSTDTLQLKKFKAKQVVIVDFVEASICIKSKDYLNLINDYRNSWEKRLSQNESKRRSEDEALAAISMIDSVIMTIENGLLRCDTIRIPLLIFDKHGVGSHADFDEYLENGKCAIYDKGRQRRFFVLRRKLIESSGNCGWGGRRYFLPENENHFFEAPDYYLQKG